jgi:hypothetical protein
VTMLDCKLSDLPITARNEIMFHALVEKEVVEMEYGTMSCTVIVKDGNPIIPSLNIVKSKRRKYKNP